MSREQIIRQLQVYESRWRDESETIRRFVEYVSSNANCCDRQLLTGHLTGSAWVVNQAGTHVLLTHHKKLRKWVQLGGHADGDTDLLRVARREVEEESGLKSVVPVCESLFDIDVHSIPKRGTVPAHLHWDLRYAMRATGNEAYTVSEESNDLAWVEIKSIRSVTEEESVLRMAAKWLKFEMDFQNRDPIPPTIHEV